MRNASLTQSNPVRRFAVLLLIFGLGAMSLAFPHADAQISAPAAVYTIKGIVYDPFFHALGGATVTVRDVAGKTIGTPATTGGDGKYSIGSLAAAKYNVTASHPKYPSSTVPVEAADPDTTIQQNFILTAQDQPQSGKIAILKGIVKDEKSGKAMAGVQIEIWNYYNVGDASKSMPVNSGNEYFQTVSGADGSYEVQLNQGSVNLNARADDYDILQANFEMMGDRTLDLPMRASQGTSVTITGTITGTDGNPIPDAYVSVSPDYSKNQCGGDRGCPVATGVAEPGYSGGGGSSSGSSDVSFYYQPRYGPYASTQADKTGAYKLQTTPGELIVSASANNYLEDHQSLSAQDGDQKKVDLVLELIPPDSVRVHGLVVDGKTGAPIPYAQVNLENQKWGHYNYTQTDKSGAYEFYTKPGYTLVTASAYKMYYVPCQTDSPPPSGDTGIRAPDSYPCDGSSNDRGIDYFPRVVVFVGNASTPKQLDFKLQPRPAPDAEFKGYVVNATSNKAVPGAQVSFYNEFTRDWGQATTDDNGSYKIKVDAGYYTIRTYAEHFFDHAENADIASGKSQRLDLVVTPGEKRYGYCCPMYMQAGKADATSAHGAPAMDTAGGSSASGASDVSPTGAPQPTGGQQAYAGEKGGLGAYKPGAKESGGASPGLAVPVILGALALALLAARRRNL